MLDEGVCHGFKWFLHFYKIVKSKLPFLSFFFSRSCQQIQIRNAKKKRLFPNYFISYDVCIRFLNNNNNILFLNEWMNVVDILQSDDSMETKSLLHAVNWIVASYVGMRDSLNLL